ncbi:MAG: hypothetical protein HC908_14770 [Calothrix sp. SM1_7_51]|nr:hypothetical protein [Calothrix sp. SM1_7_51]
MSSSNPPLDSAFQRLRDVRAKLLRLHKALLDSERVIYEQFNGRIQSNAEYLRLVIGDEWFNWLHPISQFIVQIDEVLFSKEPMTLEQATDLLSQARTLLQPKEAGTSMETRYFRAIQRDADIAFMHAEVMQLLRE